MSIRIAEHPEYVASSFDVLYIQLHLPGLRNRVAVLLLILPQPSFLTLNRDGASADLLRAFRMRRDYYEHYFEYRFGLPPFCCQGAGLPSVDFRFQ